MFCKETLCYDCLKYSENLAHLLNTSQAQILSTIRPDRPLLSLHIFEYEYHGDLCLTDWISTILNSKINNANDMVKMIAGEKGISLLKMDNFKYVLDKKNLLQFLQSVVIKKCPSVNILLYGGPGTGKTEFAKTIVNESNLEIYAIGEKQKEDYTHIATDRLKQLLFVDRVLKNNNKAVLLFDEAEDVFSCNIFQKKDISKVELNRILEQNMHPVIWISNHIEDMDPAHLRRFSYVIKFDKPTLEFQEQIWMNKCKKFNIPFQEYEIKKLAEKYNISPSFIENSLKVASLTSKNLGDVERHLDEFLLAYNGGIRKNKIGF